MTVRAPPRRPVKRAAPVAGRAPSWIAPQWRWRNADWIGDGGILSYRLRNRAEVATRGEDDAPINPYAVASAAIDLKVERADAERFYCQALPRHGRRARQP